jgi:hypothetical protein
MTRTLILISCVLLASFIMANISRADDPKFNVQELYTQCKAPVGTPESLMCLGFISGVADLMQLNGVSRKNFSSVQWSAISNEAICGAPTTGAEIQAFINWAEKHPEQWGTFRLIGAIKALRESWPCQETQ